MSVKEWEKVFEMSQDKNLYHNLCTSLFPTIHGKSPVGASEREDFTCENILFALPVVLFWENLKALCQLPQTLPTSIGYARKGESISCILAVFNH